VSDRDQRTNDAVSDLQNTIQLCGEVGSGFELHENIVTGVLLVDGVAQLALAAAPSFTRGNSTVSLAEGLYAHFGNVNGSKEAVQMYDNDGILRSEFPVLEGSAKRFLFLENRVYFNVSDTQIE